VTIGTPTSLPYAPLAFVNSTLAVKLYRGDAAGKSAFYQHPTFRIIRIFFHSTVKKYVPPLSFARRQCTISVSIVAANLYVGVPVVTPSYGLMTTRT
jgi:hypothetical protein